MAYVPPSLTWSPPCSFVCLMKGEGQHLAPTIYGGEIMKVQEMASENMRIA